MKVKRYKGKVKFINLENRECYGKFPFDFYLDTDLHISGDAGLL